MNYTERLCKVIPGGAHTYSRGADQYPENAPQILKKGKGAYVWDPEGNKFLDYGMALRAVTVGYGYEPIVLAAMEQAMYGNNLTRPSLVELEAAELFCKTIPGADMVKFGKNGSTVTSAAVKIARAYNRRRYVAICAQHPFFSYDDWFIGSTPLTLGIPKETQEKTKLFKYNDLASLETLVAQHPGELACVVLEPATTEEPKDGFLQKVRALCDRHGIVMILDEMITGFRWHMKGAQHLYGISPDLCTFGKAMANGFSVSCVAGRREIMSLGSIEKLGQERLFLLSTTHGAEMAGMGAFLATMKMMERESVVDHLWDYGRKLLALMHEKSEAHGVADSLKVGGFSCSPYYLTLDDKGAASLPLRTLFAQEMVRQGVLMPWIALSWRHGEEELKLTGRALDAALPVYKKALTEGVERYLEGPAIKPVFRKFN